MGKDAKGNKSQAPHHSPWLQQSQPQLLLREVVSIPKATLIKVQVEGKYFLEGQGEGSMYSEYIY